MPTELTGRELDAAVAEEVMGWVADTHWWSNGKTWLKCICAWDPSWDLNIASEVESEIERRGLNDLYAHYLMEQVGVDGHKPGYDESDLWKIRRATPEQVCLAALSAVRSQNAKA